MNICKDWNKKNGSTLILTMAVLGMCMIVVAAYLHFTGKTKTGFEKSTESITEQFDNIFE